ncbi:MAG: type I-E CRISPR-associated protein Cas6/Cse3/CasE [bacterium]
MYLTHAYLKRSVLSEDGLADKLYDLEGEHKIIWQLFADDPNRERDFIYCRLCEASIPTFVIVSHREPIDENNRWVLEVSSYDPSVKEGEKYHFSLKANPTVKRNGNRHDIVIDAIKYMEEERGMDKKEIPPRHVVAQKEGQLWLLKRQQQYGFKLKGNRLKIDGYRQHIFRKTRNGRRVKLSSLDFTGLMEVADVDKFKDALFNGIGPAKAYGFGCLLAKKLEA